MNKNTNKFIKKKIKTNPKQELIMMT